MKYLYIYIYSILLFNWIIAYCKTTKRIGTLNFNNMNLPFLIVCLSIAGHTTQGYTGDALHNLFITRCAIGKQIIKLLDRCCNKCR